MKKYIYNIGICLLALCFAGCSEEELVGGNDDPQGKVTTGTAEMTFSVQIPEANSINTRAFGEDFVDRENVYLVVFDASGYLTEYAKAQDVTTIEGETFFKVTLNQTEYKRAVHFIANYDIGTLSFGSESQLIGGLTTTGNNDAYWQRVEFPDGIYGTKDELTGVITVAPAVAALMSKVPLVRNFAKISVRSDAEKFALEGFAIVNTPDRGTVAPYKGDGVFMPYEANMTYAGLDYAGVTPSGMNVNTAVPGDGAFSTASKYMYERRVSAENPTFIIVKGKYNGGASGYYKIDLGQKDGDDFEYYNILRNFHYIVNIDRVSATGYATAQLAATQSVAFNNIYASTATQNLLNISDGEYRLFVNFTNRILVSQAPVELKYKYVPVDNLTNGTRNSQVVIDWGDAKGSNVIDTHDAAASAADSEGWSTISFTPKAPVPNTPLEQIITLRIPGGLSRTVNLTLYTPREMYDEKASPAEGMTTIGTEVGTEVAVSFEIVAGLSEYMFPLEFKLESDRGNLYNNPQNEDAMVVWYGTSTIPSKAGQQAFGFTKLLTYEAYQAIPTGGANQRKLVVCSFLTNKAAEAGDETTVYITNPYFTPKEVKFTQK
jgi:hypothetical protein